jgi:hypothetical protein
MWEARPVSGFDAELHLRLLGERTLMSRPEWHYGRSQLSTTAQALVAVEAIDPELAEAVIDDYHLAAALRSGQLELYSMRTHRADRDAHAAPLAPRRVVPCDRVIEKGGDTLHVRYVSLDDDSTTVAVTYSTQPPQPRRRHGRAAMMMAGGMMAGGAFGSGGRLHQITLGDDRGTTVATHFSGGGSDLEWRGHLDADRPLAKDTAWIEVDGGRIELEELPPPGEVFVERLPDESPALRHLWSLVATPDDFHGPTADLEPAIEALTAAGALAPDDPTLADVRAVAAIVDRHQHPRGARRIGRLPEPWRSLLARRGSVDGPSGTAAIGLFTPVFDGIAIAALSLESGEEGFEVEVEVTPNLVMHDPFEDSGLGRTLTWWARDDRGNHYLGHVGDWGGGGACGHGGVSFGPALDPRAGRLELLPTAETSRAVISFELPWATGEASA